MSRFVAEHKSIPKYLDSAINGHGAEKAFLTLQALQRISRPNVDVLEVGPGGGSSVDALIQDIESSPEDSGSLNLTLIEKDSIESAALSESMKRFSAFGKVALYAGDITRLDEQFEPESFDILAASSVIHEVYSYSGGYRAINEAVEGVTSLLRDEGYFAYRDVYAVDAPSLHERATHTYSSEAWTRFIAGFLPQYIEGATHPYHHDDDEVSFRQDSRLKSAERIDTKADTVIEAPVGLLREIQRHYLTFRDHLWRSGSLGFTPTLEGGESNNWLDIKNGHKYVNFRLSESDLMNESQRALLTDLCEPNGDSYDIDGDIFDEITDISINTFMQIKENDATCREVWDEWLRREGLETYSYLTIDELINKVAVKSSEGADSRPPSMLLPAVETDVLTAPRLYYNRFLTKNLSNPLYDGKQMILFKKITLADDEQIRKALLVAQRHCSRKTIAKLYSTISHNV